MKIIHENYGVKNYMKEDYRSYRRKLLKLRKQGVKKKNFRLVRDSDPLPLRYRCSALPSELTIQLGAGR